VNFYSPQKLTYRWSRSFQTKAIFSQRYLGKHFLLTDCTGIWSTCKYIPVSESIRKATIFKFYFKFLKDSLRNTKKYRKQPLLPGTVGTRHNVADPGSIDKKRGTGIKLIEPNHTVPKSASKSGTPVEASIWCVWREGTVPGSSDCRGRTFRWKLLPLTPAADISLYNLQERTIFILHLQSIFDPAILVHEQCYNWKLSSGYCLCNWITSGSPL
jgi:hypothetical protein